MTDHGEPPPGTAYTLYKDEDLIDRLYAAWTKGGDLIDRLYAARIKP